MSQRNLRWIFLLLTALPFGCADSKRAERIEAAKESAAARAKETPETWWCATHGVPKSICAQCDAKLAEAAKAVGATTIPYLQRVFRYVFEVGLTSKEMADGLGIYGASRRSRLNAACKALAEVGILQVTGHGTFRVDRDLVQRQQALAELRRR